ncbi:MAG: hypothetical protein KIT14_00225 [bacterium]|nr:hypothetical protein [bacterium]
MIGLLDELQAAEHAGADALARWIASCRDPRLRGGMRVIQARDAAHARLAVARLHALGGRPTATPTRSLTSLCGVLAAQAVSDRSKLSILIARFPAATDDPLAGLGGVLEGDPETRALLEAVRDDDRVSLGWLRGLADVGPEPVVASGRGETAFAAGFCDALRAAEAASAEVVEAWVAVCRADGLRGGLRAIAARERVHAALLTERLAELGGTPRMQVPEASRAAALARWGVADVADESKLDGMLARYPTDDVVARPLGAVAAALAGDAETRELLRLLAAAEVSTVAWLRAYRGGLGGDSAHAVAC